MKETARKRGDRTEREVLAAPTASKGLAADAFFLGSKDGEAHSGVLMRPPHNDERKRLNTGGGSIELPP